MPVYFSSEKVEGTHMFFNTEVQLDNPLADIIPDDVYKMLEHHSLLSEKGIRDYHIRIKFRNLRAKDVSACDAIEILREEYPYLQFDTVRKIVYKLNSRKS